jgi:hypothetical protein
MGETAARIRSALASQTTLLEGRHRGEHCGAFSARPHDLLQRCEQYQVRLRRAAAGGEYALFTVSETHGAVGGEGVVFAGAVAFHGWDLPHIGVGGRAETGLKERARCAIEEAVRGSVRDVLDSTSGFSGTSRRNIVNRLAASGKGLRIEQPLPARREYGEAIAAAVGAVLAAGEPDGRG